jgi:hypothetical protein
MARIVAAETLDGLAADDPAAMRSRQDLRRLHRAMGTRAITVRALRSMTQSRAKAGPLRLLELGAGDGTLMLGVARALAPAWPQVELTLLDRLRVVDPTTIESYAHLGWTAVAKTADALDWAAAVTDSPLSDHATGRWDLIVANLFLHHFEGAQLVSLLGAIAARSNRFFACEPRRSWVALAGSHCVGVLGANAVTREDAVLSVQAGFRGTELAELWPPRGAEWKLQDYAAGLFSHCFRAERFEAN